MRAGEAMTPAQRLTLGLIFMALFIGHAWMDTPLPAIGAMIAVVFKLVHPGFRSISARHFALIAAATLAFAVLVIQWSSEAFSASAARALVLFAGLKFLESQTRRDLYILVHVGFFLLATFFLVAQTIFAAFFGIAVVLALTAVLLDANTAGRRPPLRGSLLHAARLLTYALPLTLVLFIAFPRLAAPLWSFHQGADSTGGITGLSDRMTPGSISELVQSTEIALRARFDGPPPEPPSRYWRGPVLWRTDGTSWMRRGDAEDTPDPASGSPSAPLSYQLIMEPNGMRWIPALDFPLAAPGSTKLNDDLELMAVSPSRERARYTLASLSNPAIDRPLSAAQRSAGLQLPDAVSPRVRALALGWRSAADSDLDVVTAALAHFRNEAFRYSLSPPLTGRDPVDDFLFETRSGFCEHYAASFAVLMRAAGIPARIITGYQGGEVNPHNGYIIVRQADAHAWNEVWIEDAGWLRIDPTAAVAPERIEQGFEAAASLSGNSAAASAMAQGPWRWLGRQASWLWDALDTAWYTRVVNFDRQRQQDLWSRWGLSGIGAVFGYGLAVFAVILVLGLTWLIGRALEHRVTDPARTLYDRFCRKLARRGLQRAPNEGPRAFVNRISNELSTDSRDQAWTITREYLALRYGPSPAAQSLRTLKRRIRRFRP